MHRDLKPGNVMISDGEPVVIDFGIAQLPETTRLTLTGMFMGTPGYLAPEVIEGKESGAASDVHSWAATVAFAATGRPPYGTGPFETIFYRIMHGAPDLDTMPEPLRAIILAALSRNPASRPSAAEIGRRIGAIDPATLIPSPPAVAARLPDGRLNPRADAGPAVALGALPRTLGDDQGWQAWPTSTRPLSVSGSSDVRDLLPPVSYQPPRGLPGAGGQAAGGYPAAGNGLGNGAGPGGAAGADLAGGGRWCRAVPGVATIPRLRRPARSGQAGGPTVPPAARSVRCRPGARW